MNTSKISRRSFLKGVGAAGATGLLAACGGSDSTAASGSASGGSAAAEGKVINIYSWNDEFRTRLASTAGTTSSAPGWKPSTRKWRAPRPTAPSPP